MSNPYLNSLFHFSCRKLEATYTCPRCGIQYCSIACYQGHGNQCKFALSDELDEQFLRSQKVDESSNRQFAAKLQKIMSIEDSVPSLNHARLEELIDKLLGKISYFP